MMAHGWLVMDCVHNNAWSPQSWMTMVELIVVDVDAENASCVKPGCVAIIG